MLHVDMMSRSWQPLGMAEQTEAATVQKALDEARTHFPPEPKVADMQHGLFVDSLGYDAVRVLVVLNDRTAGDPYYHLDELKPIHDEIHRVFQAHDIRRWPYVTFELVSERDAPLGEEEDGADGSSPVG